MLPGKLQVELHAEVTSTQEVARAALVAGRSNVHGLVVRARSQRQGRGRLERRWASEPGGSYQTLLLADASRAFQSSRVPIAVAVGLAEALATRGVTVGLKWPNDLYLTGSEAWPAEDGKLPGKLGGILCEHVRGHLLVGVGINVSNRLPPGAAALSGFDPDEVSDLVLEGLRSGLGQLFADSGLAARFSRFDLLAGRRLRVVDSSRELTGRGAGLDEDGCLLLARQGVTARTCSGRIAEIDAATL